MKGVESIIGGYLIAVLLITVASSLYAWISFSSENIRSQLSDSIERIQYINHPPILSLIHVKDRYFKLLIQPVTPIYIKDVLVKSINNDLLYLASIESLITDSVEIEIAIHETPAIIMIIADKGVVYYYSPRLDPLLSIAPDHVRNKPYIDNDLIQFLVATRESMMINGLYIYNNLGYKILVGTVVSSVEDIVLNGPIQCWSSRDGLNQGVDTLGCNINALLNDSYLSFLTYNVNRSKCYFTNEGFLVVLPEICQQGVGPCFFQIMRLVKVSEKPIELTLNYTIILDIVDPYNTYITSVVYVIPPVHKLDSPIVIAPPNTGNIAWLYRRVITKHRLEIGYNSIIHSTTLTINPLEYGFREVIVAIGLEYTYKGSGAAQIKIDVTPVV
ncbi:MAG: hypothetical protein QXE81_05250 [Desulfurococcaceae archaeon]